MRRRALISMLAFAGCLNPYVDASPFGTGPGMPGGTDGSSGGGSSTSGSSTSSTGDVHEDSSVGGSAGTTMVFDVGVPDLPPQVGCQGKIDFLFVISTMKYKFSDGIQEKLIEAVPQFIATIQEKFADFDYHIMVVDGDHGWGRMECNGPPCPSPACEVEDYPTCEEIAARTECDGLIGSGIVFPAGPAASNKLCPIASGNRYLTGSDPELAETFACMAKVGTYTSFRLAESMVHAISPEMNGPGGCNEGFLRDDALLFVTFVSDQDDDDSEGTPETWMQAVLDAKGDPGSVVMFAIDSAWTYCKWDWYPSRICEFIREFPYWYSVDESGDFGTHFEIAAELVDTACSQFIPQ